MKRSAASSLAKPAAAKKQKLDNVINSVSKVVPVTKTKAPIAAQISAKQLKGFHFLLYAAIYHSKFRAASGSYPS
jgi:hypothetical protein